MLIIVMLNVMAPLERPARDKHYSLLEQFVINFHLFPPSVETLRSATFEVRLRLNPALVADSEEAIDLRQEAKVPEVQLNL
jgi:hypothetical protein